MYAAQQQLWRSLTSGQTWPAANPVTAGGVDQLPHGRSPSTTLLHWDHHELAFAPPTWWDWDGGNPVLPTPAYHGTDGGIARSGGAGDGPMTFTQLNQGIATSLLTSLDIGRGAGNTEVTFAGMQDTGTAGHRRGDGTGVWLEGYDNDGGPVARRPGRPGHRLRLQQREPAAHHQRRPDLVPGQRTRRGGGRDRGRAEHQPGPGRDHRPPVPRQRPGPGGHQRRPRRRRPGQWRGHHPRPGRGHQDLHPDREERHRRTRFRAVPGGDRRPVPGPGGYRRGHAGGPDPDRDRHPARLRHRPERADRRGGGQHRREQHRRASGLDGHGDLADTAVAGRLGRHPLAALRPADRPAARAGGERAGAGLRHHQRQSGSSSPRRATAS